MTLDYLYDFINRKPVILFKNNESYQVEEVCKNEKNLYVYGKRKSYPNLKYAFILDSIYDYFTNANGDVEAFFNGNKEFVFKRGILN